MIDYSLNPAQYAAVFSDSPRILCLAGAGTGKTQVLTRRVARLSESGIPAGEMLALTFTRAAGAEMKDRVIKLIGDDGKQLFCNTFHAFCITVIREHIRKIGYEPGFSIYSPAEQQSLMLRVIQDLKLKITLPAVEGNRTGRGTVSAIQRKQAETALKEYKARLRYNNAFDFESLIEYARELLSRPEIADIYRERYTHVFVDEFQDTDPTQWELVSKINPKNLFVVGDDFQAIYGFRGSDIKIILSLAENPEWETIKLEINYRSTAPIIAAANNLIKHNTQTEKTLIAQKDGDKLEITAPDDFQAEIINIIPRLKQNIERGISTAILARTNKQLANARTILNAHNVPCTSANESTNPFLSAGAKLVFDWFDAVENQNDDTAVKNVAYHYISADIIDRIEAEQYKSQEGHFLSYASQNEQGFEFVQLCEEMQGKYAEWSDNAPHEIVEGFADRLRIDDTKPLIAAIERWESKQREHGGKCTLEALREYAKLSAMIEAPAPKLTADEIHLMTAHGSKGLEFEDVFIIGAVRGIFPNKGDLEEERRLFYVAMTRARERLTISCPRTIEDFRGGNHETTQSPFIEEALNP